MGEFWHTSLSNKAERKRKMRNFILFLLSLIIVTTHVGALETVPIDGYAAMVNDRVITVGDVMIQLQPVEQQFRELYEGQELETKLEEAFAESREYLIERALILEAFKSSGMDLPERVIEERVNEIINERFNNNRAAFLEALATERITIDEWRTQIKEQIVLMILRRQEVTEQATVSPLAVWDLYESRIADYSQPAKIKLSRIVINAGANDEETVIKRKEADAVIEKLRQGDNFSDVARQVSEETRAARGGEWGWRNPADLHEELSAAIISLKPGEFSEVVEVGDTFYIVMVEGRKEALVKPFEDVRDDIEKELRIEEENRLYEAWIARLRDKFFIKIF